MLRICSTISISWLFMFATPISAQVPIIDVGNIGFGVSQGGVLCHSNEISYSAAPIGGNNHIISRMYPIWSAYDADNQLYGDIIHMSNDWLHAGPHTQESLTIENEYNVIKYKEVQNIYQREIDTFKLRFRDSTYQIPESIKNWPANGDINIGMADQLAPFADHNNNYLYEPDSGDYPLIKGDQAIFQLLHDLPTGQHLLEGDTNFSQLEYHQLVYGYDSDPSSLLYNTVFIDMKIINRSNRTYHDFVFGYLTFFELGYYNNNYLGTDSTRFLQFAYNGDTTDNYSDAYPYYGSILPAAGVQFLNAPMNSSMDPGSELSEISLERFQFYQRAIWPYDTVHMTDDYSGYGGDVLTNYSYHDHPDIPGGWSEVQQQNPPSESRGYSSTYYGDFHPGDTICHTSAVLFADGTIPYNRTIAVTDLIEMATALQNIYPLLPDANKCLTTIQEDPYWQTSGELSDGITFLPYPNPANDVVFLNSGSFDDGDLKITLHHVNGQLVGNWIFEDISPNKVMRVDLPPDLGSGLYYISGEWSGFYFTRQLFVQ